MEQEVAATATAKITAAEAAKLNEQFPKGVAAWMIDPARALTYKQVVTFMGMRQSAFPATK